MSLNRTHAAQSIGPMKCLLAKLMKRHHNFSTPGTLYTPISLTVFRSKSFHTKMTHPLKIYS